MTDCTREGGLNFLSSLKINKQKSGGKTVTATLRCFLWPFQDEEK